MFHVASQLIALGQPQLSTKRCSSCFNYKLFSEFSIKDKEKGWFDTRCKPCKSELISKYQKDKKQQQDADPEFAHFMKTFEGIHVSKIIKSFDTLTFDSVCWGKLSKRCMAEKWAARFSVAGVESLRTVDLEQVRKLALSY